jgi:catechol-2,3-dioxygenase
MQLLELTLATPSLDAQRDFYTQVLGLPVSPESDQLIVQAGASRLIFKSALSNWQGTYHFAFNIPENKFTESKAWLKDRTPLIRNRAGKDEFSFESWNAHAFYFYDAAGNILEFIARHSLPNASLEPFSAASILNVSEIGVTVSNVLETVATYQNKFGIAPYGGKPEAEFAALGDEQGLLIVVKQARNWAPDTIKPADFLPLQIKMQTPLGERQLAFA